MKSKFFLHAFDINCTGFMTVFKSVKNESQQSFALFLYFKNLYIKGNWISINLHNFVLRNNNYCYN